MSFGSCTFMYVSHCVIEVNNSVNLFQNHNIHGKNFICYVTYSINKQVYQGPGTICFSKLCERWLIAQYNHKKKDVTIPPWCQSVENRIFFNIMTSFSTYNLQSQSRAWTPSLGLFHDSGNGPNAHYKHAYSLSDFQVQKKFLKLTFF